MQIETGHLVNLESEDIRKRFLEEKEIGDIGKCFQKEKEMSFLSMEESLREQGYTPVPAELEKAAEKKLAGQDEAYVSLTSGGKLSKWAAKQRKAKRKKQKASRRKNW